MALTHLLLMRHAKSAWGDPELEDHERPLNARGREACEIISKAMVARDLAPETIWASSAVRTQETAKRLMRALPGPQLVVNVPEFYHASAGQVLDYLAGESEPEGKLMLLGHNPGWEGLVERLSGEVQRMPTGAVYILARNTAVSEWWSPSAWRALDYLTPKSVTD
jgi:phosphohistidine phosphatase